MPVGTNIPATAVLVLGAGPAGLVLANLLCAAGVDCVVVERRGRAHVEQRARAGFLSPDSVDVLRAHGLDHGLRHAGRTHDRCEFRSAAGRVELRYSELGRGRVHTVYPQQLLVTDLIAELLRRGGRILFDTTATAIGGLHEERPWALLRDARGAETRYEARYLAGCDGARGIARSAVPAATAVRDHGITWLALLVQAPPTSHSVLYGVHGDGFAGQMPRSPDVTRYYLQCDPAAGVDDWDEQRIWAELDRRLDAPRYGAPARGPILERGLVRLRSEILDPIQHGRLLLAGDAATSISPSAAKGANLAIAEARLLARALTTAVHTGDETALHRYSADCLPLIRRAQEFSHWMIDLLHPPAPDDPEAAYQRMLRSARLHSLATSESHRHFFADNYVGI
ncbi:4-hydroxybenzoate 3-monooxygenase [Nocardia sp. 2]|uniref:4-hydroxybenzoate 3-monooxygenase n=1 Tax=Nocardia acididurans TaxID=2802282 RepID=A0ABS1M3Z3_9NOCA|nr:4-hydroxybenzoate 3-monooxygenase [Nocardia acididurans]MBL1075372.1 4-hydroxybenzoate 3-monooxygenase [Nocardia acididurans]